jgi:hypothetical protein
VADITCCYSRRGRWHCLQIVDELAYVDRDYGREERGYDWMEVIEWAVANTENQPKIRRMAFDQWYFHSRKELDKFVTVLIMRFPGCTPPSS